MERLMGILAAWKEPVRSLLYLNLWIIILILSESRVLEKKF